MITLWQYKLGNNVGELREIKMIKQPKRLDDLIDQLPAGVYTTFRTFHKYSILNLAAHIQRLENSAQLKSRSIKINEDLFRKNLHKVLEKHPANENRVRIIFTWPSESGEGVIYMATEELQLPGRDLYQSGVQVKSVKLSRKDPEAKTTDFIQQTIALRGEITNGLNELLMIDEDGVILEGLSSNFFAVRHHSVITRGEGVLAGITRDLVIQIINNTSIDLRFQGIPLSELSKLDESFITSTSRGVLPVVKVDGVQIGS